MMHQIICSEFDYVFIIKYNTYVFDVLLLFILSCRKRMQRGKKCMLPLNNTQMLESDC